MKKLPLTFQGRIISQKMNQIYLTESQNQIYQT